MNCIINFKKCYDVVTNSISKLSIFIKNKIKKK